MELLVIFGPAVVVGVIAALVSPTEPKTPPSVPLFPSTVPY